MKIASKIICAAILFSATATSAHSFDGQRKGFQLGLGIGAHSTALNFSQSNSPVAVDSSKEMAVSIQLGYGFSNTIVGFVGGKGGSIVVDDFGGSLAIGGIGATVYMSETSPSLYVTGLFGSGSLSMNERESEDSELRDSGKGWLAGIGYEVTDRLHLELSYGRAELVDPNDTRNTSELESAFATVQYVWY